MSFYDDVSKIDIFSSVYSEISQNQKYVKIKFPKLDYTKGNHPHCGLSLKSAGSMRYRNAEHNQNRIDFFASIGIDKNQLRQPELIHSKEVFNCFLDEDKNPVYESFLQNTLTKENLLGDGIITSEKNFVPVITVADCVPIWFYDPVTAVFGVVHSGWKGTGIIENALLFANQKYNSNIRDFRVIIGPHIHSCCYKVEKDREDFFNTNFASDSCTNQMLSLEKANLFVLEKLGVQKENILVSKNCTSCESVFGSFRRETGANIEKPFTVMSAFVSCVSR